VKLKWARLRVQANLRDTRGGILQIVVCESPLVQEYAMTCSSGIEDATWPPCGSTGEAFRRPSVTGFYHDQVLQGRLEVSLMYSGWVDLLRNGMSMFHLGALCVERLDVAKPWDGFSPAQKGPLDQVSGEEGDRKGAYELDRGR
jgi:hypothetical protein